MKRQGQSSSRTIALDKQAHNAIFFIPSYMMLRKLVTRRPSFCFVGEIKKGQAFPRAGPRRRGRHSGRHKVGAFIGRAQGPRNDDGCRERSSTKVKYPWSVNPAKLFRSLASGGKPRTNDGSHPICCFGDSGSFREHARDTRFVVEIEYQWHQSFLVPELIWQLSFNNFDSYLLPHVALYGNCLSTSSVPTIFQKWPWPYRKDGLDA